MIGEEVYALDEMCERCGCCQLEARDCDRCGGEGETAPGELYEDPLWYDQDDVEPCGECYGKGRFVFCSGDCDANGKHGAASVGT